MSHTQGVGVLNFGKQSSRNDNLFAEEHLKGRFELSYSNVELQRSKASQRTMDFAKR